MRTESHKSATKIRSSLLWEATKRYCRVQKCRSVIMDNSEEEESEAEAEAADEAEADEADEAAMDPCGHSPSPHESFMNSSTSVDIQQLRVFVGTWNVGGLKPPPLNHLQNEEEEEEEQQPWDMMNEWINNQTTNQAEKADLYVIGFQEIVPLNAANILLGANLREGGEDAAAHAASQWDNLISSTLNTHSHINQMNQSPNPNPNHDYGPLITSSSRNYGISASNDLQHPSIAASSCTRSRRRSLTAPPSPITHHNHDPYDESEDVHPPNNYSYIHLNLPHPIVGYDPFEEEEADPAPNHQRNVLFSLLESELRMQNAGRSPHEPPPPPPNPAPGPKLEAECHPSALASHVHHITPDNAALDIGDRDSPRGPALASSRNDHRQSRHVPPVVVACECGRCDTLGRNVKFADSTGIDKMYCPCPRVKRHAMSQANGTYYPRRRAQTSRHEVIGSRIGDHQHGGAASRRDENIKKYIKVVNKQMVGLFVSVWAREDLCSHIKGVEVSCVGCGIMGYLGNKGAVSVSLTIGETSMCFICSHLNSGDKPTDVLRRNDDVTQILRRTRFRRSHRMKRSTSLIDNSNQDTIEWSKYYNNYLPQSILGHDRIIWFGDLNYRLSLPLEDLKSLVAKEDWEALLAKDELKHEKAIGGVFEGWHEGPILFAPTYKYVPNTDAYYMLHAPTHERVKRRAPAWCDRILWYGKGLKQMSYTRSELRHSDHRPVASVFLVEIEVLKKPSISEIFKKHQYPQFTKLIPCITKVQVDDIVSPNFKQQETPTRGDGHVITLNIMS